MWLDGLYMGQPFMAEYAKLFHEDKAFDDIVLQFRLMEKYSRDPKTGLLYHGWDESREQKWANKTTRQFTPFLGKKPRLVWHGIGGCAGLFPSQPCRKKRYLLPSWIALLLQ